jgi:hypothetical protein
VQLNVACGKGIHLLASFTPQVLVNDNGAVALRELTTSHFKQKPLGQRVNVVHSVAGELVNKKQLSGFSDYVKIVALHCQQASQFQNWECLSPYLFCPLACCLSLCICLYPIIGSVAL